MPGLTGILGADAPADFFELGTAPLAVPGVRDGAVFVSHQDATPLSFGLHSDPSSGVAVAFWGEFYHDEWSHLNTGEEVAEKIGLRLDAEGVERTLRSLNGSFCLFAQLRDGAQVIAADRCGSRPVYYSIRNGQLRFAPHPRILGRGAALDEDAALSFLVNGFCLADRTLFRDVRLLAPAHLLRRGPGGWTAFEYRPCVFTDQSAPESELDHYCDEFIESFRATMKAHSRFLERSVVPISGGLDSRAVLAGIREFYGGPLKTVTWGTGEDDPEADGAVGRRVAEYFATDHRFLRRCTEQVSEDLPRRVREFDLANDDCLQHPHEADIIRSLRHDLGCTVLFRGDKCFISSGVANSAYEALGQVSIQHAGQFTNLPPLLDPSRARALLNGAQQLYDSLWKQSPYRDWTLVKEWLFVRQEAFRYLGASHYIKLSVLEARNPLMDGRIFDFFERVPRNFRLYRKLFRVSVERMFPDLMRRIPLAKKASLEDWGRVLRNDAKFRRLVEGRLFAPGDSPLWSIVDRRRVRELSARFFDGPDTPSLRTRLVESAKDVLRTYAGPLYAALKKTGGPALALREFPPHLLIGRCLALRIWLDANA